MLPTDRPVYVPSGTELSLTNNPKGCRTYLAVAGGWDVAKVLGSRSTYTTASFGGHDGRALRAGDTLHAREDRTDIAAEWYRRLQGAAIHYPRWAIARRLFMPAGRSTIRVVPAQ